MKKILILSAVSLGLFSCATKKQIIYFQDAEVLNESEIGMAFEPIIEPNDILYVSVSSMDEEVVRPFKREAGFVNSNNVGNPGLNGYLVNVSGDINFPVLGAITVAGKTRGEVENDLKTKLLEYVRDVVVDVRIMNFKVTVLGEVRNPGVFTIKDDRVTLPEALGLAGDLTEDGSRSMILVVREDDSKRVVSRIDLTQTDFFSSPFYFLKQNDVVYVQPSLKGVKKSGFIPSIPALLSLFTVMLSTAIIIFK